MAKTTQQTAGEEPGWEQVGAMTFLQPRGDPYQLRCGETSGCARVA